MFVLHNIKKVMNFLVQGIFLLLLVSQSHAFPRKDVTVAFVKGMEDTVKEGNRVIRRGNTMDVHDHSVRVKKMRARADQLFVAADPCHFAAVSASNLWRQQLLQLQKPSKLGEEFIRRIREDYRDNLGYCRDSVKAAR